MRIKRGLLVLVLLCIIVFSCASLTTGQPPQPVKGPRVDELLFKLYPDASAELQAFNACEIDIVDTDMDPSAAWNETIVHKPYETADMYDFELNNNRTIPTYPSWTSPMWDANFRHALAHLADKGRYVTDVLNGWGVVLDTPVMPWLQEWFNPTADKHPFNRTMAAQILDAAGYTVGLIDFRVYPLWHEKAGQSLDPLVFVSRMDPSRLAVAQMFRDELLAIGIPVDFLQMTAAQAYQKVFVQRDYHIYTGGFLLFTDPDPVYLYDLYHSNPMSKDLINDSELDFWLDLLKNAPDHATAKTAASEAQRRLADIAGTIPLWTSKTLKGHKKGWAGTVNERGFGIDSWWTFINAWHYNYTAPCHANMPKPWTIRYGLNGFYEFLNPVYITTRSDMLILNKIYDTLMRENPFDPSKDLTWMASSWEVSTWIDPIGLEEKTKLTFHINNNIYWHTTMPPPIPLTSADVKFTIEYLKNYPDATYSGSVADVNHVEAPDPYTVVVYENVLSYWTLHSIGKLPILPKHVWENIADPHGFMPDPTLTGSGPFMFTGLSGTDTLILAANRNYFMPWHPKGDINFDKVVDIFDLVHLALAFGSVPGDPNWNQHADIASHYEQIDIFDIVTLALDFGKEWLPDP